MGKVIFDKAKNSFLHPHEFFKGMVKEKGIKESFTYFSILSLISSILSVVGLFIFNTQIGKVDLGQIGPFLVLGYLIGLALAFAWAGILFLWLKLFKAKGKYEKAYQLYAYSRTPKFVLGWIPPLSLVGWIYSFVLLIIGAEVIYKIRRTKAILMFAIPGAIIIIASFALAYFAYTLQGTGGVQ